MSEEPKLKGLVGIVMVKVEPKKEKEFYEKIIEKVKNPVELSRRTGIAVFGVIYLFGWYDFGLICVETQRIGQSYDLRTFILEEIRNDKTLKDIVIDTATITGETYWVPDSIRDSVRQLQESDTGRQ